MPGFERRRNFGLVQDSFDPRDLWSDEINLGADVELPESYRVEGLHYEYQGGYPFCVTFAMTTMLEHRIKDTDGSTVRLSQPHPFFHSNGNKTGTGFRRALQVARNDGVIHYGRMPMPDNPVATIPNWYNTLRKKALSIPFTDSVKIEGFARVPNDRELLKREIFTNGPVLVGVVAQGSYYQDYAKRLPGYDNHAVLLVGWEKDGSWIIFDSLGYVSGRQGYRPLHRDYGFPSAYTITGLPDDWKKKVEDERAEGFEHCLNHYGKPRDFALEQKVAAKLVKEFQKFKNQSVWEAAGKFWSVYTNAVAYGGYSISYGITWMPGDVINDCYHWRRTGEHIFDFNKLRSEHK